MARSVGGAPRAAARAYARGALDWACGSGSPSRVRRHKDHRTRPWGPSRGSRGPEPPRRAPRKGTSARRRLTALDVLGKEGEHALPRVCRRTRVVVAQRFVEERVLRTGIHLEVVREDRVSMSSSPASAGTAFFAHILHFLQEPTSAKWARR